MLSVRRRLLCDTYLTRYQLNFVLVRSKSPYTGGHSNPTLHFSYPDNVMSLRMAALSAWFRPDVSLSGLLATVRGAFDWVSDKRRQARFER